MSHPEAKGLRHIAFTVKSLEDVMKIVECEEIRTDWFGRRFMFCKDPDGQPIELKEKVDIKPDYREPINWIGEMPVAGEEWEEEYKKQFGAEPSFF